MALPNSENIISRLAKLPDQALKQMAMMHKADPYVLPLIISEDGRRKQMRQAAQAQMAMAQPKVADAAVDQIGIAQLPTPNMQQMADGGIAGYDDFNFAQSSEPVLRMAGGGVPGYAKGNAIKVYEDRIRAEAERQGVDPDLAVRMFVTESSGKKDAVSPKGAAGLGQLMIPAAKEMGLSPEERFDPNKNIPASIGYLKKQLVKYNGDPEKALAAYNWGPGSLDKHLAKNEGKLNRIGLPKETADYLTKILPIGSASAEEVPKAEKTAASASKPEGLTDKEIEALSRPAFVTPSSGKGRKEGKLSEVVKSGEAPRQMALGVSDLPYNLLGAPMDIGYNISKAFGNKGPAPVLGSAHLKRLGTEYLGREADSTDPTLRGFRTAGEFAGMAVDPFATTRKVAQTAEGLQALALAQRAKAAEAEAKVQTPVGLRLEPPRTEPPVMVSDSKGRVMPADTRARVEQAFADEAAVATEAAKAAQLEKQAAAYPGATQRAEMLQKAEMADKARGAATAAKVGDPENMSKLGITTARPEVGESVSGAYDFDGIPEATKDKVVETAKAVVPEKKGFSLSDEDYLSLGLRLMANKNPNFLVAAGEAGLGALSDKKEREKAVTEKALRESQTRYQTAYADALERGAKEKNMAFEAEKEVNDYMEKWDRNNKMIAFQDPTARAREEQRIRQQIYASAGLKPIMGTQTASSAANLDPLGILGKKG